MANFLNWKVNLPESLRVNKKNKDKRKETLEREIIHHQKIIEKENSVALLAYLDEIKKYKKISIKKQDRLLKRINKGDVKSRIKLINGSLLRVVHIAQDNYDGKVPLEDLIQEGNIGLLISIDKYLKGNFKNFASYSSFWIYQGLTRCIGDCSRTIRIPVHLNEKIVTLNQYKKKKSIKNIDQNNINEISLKTNISIDILKIILCLPKKVSFKSLLQSYSDKSQNNDYLYESIFKESFKISLNEVLSTLDERERKIINLRFGLENNKEYTLEEIGKIFGVTRERIRQIETKALRKLKHPSRRKKIIDFY